LEKTEQNYFIQYKIKRNSEEENKTEENPALFIFLIDQSGSMS
jgi:Mg-chelatase subunit ChlD